MGVVHVAKAGIGRVASADTHTDLPKHAFGSCAICNQRIVAHHDEHPPVAAVATLRNSGEAMPTRFLVQTSVVEPATDGRA